MSPASTPTYALRRRAAQACALWRGASWARRAPAATLARMKLSGPILSALLLAAMPLVGACGDDTDHDHDPSNSVAQTVRFAARFGSEPFACGRTYAGVGTTSSTVTPLDLRLYVSDVVLIAEGGAQVPLTLTDGPFQKDGLALLDFEDATGRCITGTGATHTTLEGTAPDQHYQGLRFTIGVPFAKNHGDASTAAAPLDETAMFWSWQSGYKFLRLELATRGQPRGFLLHLGSTGCDGTEQGGVTTCAAPNRVSVALDAFDPSTKQVVLDVAALLAASDVDSNTPMTPPGCMSGPTDPECPAMFGKLGLPSGAQAFVRAE